MKHMTIEDYKSVISQSLIKANWMLANIEIESEWFANEHWIFESVAQNYGLRIFVSPIVDPQLSEGQLAYIRAGDNFPASWQDTAGQIAQLWGIKGGLKKGLKKFTNDINEFRNQVHEGTSNMEA